MTKTESIGVDKAKGNAGARDFNQWSSILFFIAGTFMLINVVFLWIRFYSDSQLSILWAAIPAIIGLAASVLGLLKLYPRISYETPWLARCGAGFAIVASTALCIAAIWILGASIFAGGISEPPPAGILALIGIFMVSMVIAFICCAVAFLINSSSRKIGYLLLVPVACWGVMLVVGMINGMEVGLSLDFYTNGLIAIAFLSIGFLAMQKHPG